MDKEQVIAGVRELYLPAAKLYEAFPESRASVDKPIYQQRGSSSRVTLADEAELVLEHEIRVAEDGFSVKLAEEGTDVKRMLLYVRSESPIEMDLSSDQFDRIVMAKGARPVVRQVWSERPQSKHLGDGIYTVPE